MRTWVWHQNPLVNARYACYLSSKEAETGGLLRLTCQAILTNWWMLDQWNGISKEVDILHEHPTQGWSLILTCMPTPHASVMYMWSHIVHGIQKKCCQHCLKMPWELWRHYLYFFFLFMCMSSWSASMSMTHLCAWYPWKPEESTDVSELELQTAGFVWFVLLEIRSLTM